MWKSGSIFCKKLDTKILTVDLNWEDRHEGGKKVCFCHTIIEGWRRNSFKSHLLYTTIYHTLNIQKYLKKYWGKANKLVARRFLVPNLFECYRMTFFIKKKQIGSGFMYRTVRFSSHIFIKLLKTVKICLLVKSHPFQSLS